MSEELPIIIGIDEAGRGPVFGPMVVGGSCNISNWINPGVKDSKLIKLESVRKSLAEQVKQHTIWATAVISVDVINQFGTLNTLRVAGQRVAEEMITRVRSVHPDRSLKIVFDGRDHPANHKGNCHFESLEKADSLVFECSCASIIAKVLHDNIVHDIVQSDAKYRCYDLENNKGYGTPKHKLALQQYGVTDQHRREATDTFLGFNDAQRTRKAAFSFRRNKETTT